MNNTTQSYPNVNHASILESLSIPYMAYEAWPPYRIIDENTAHENVAFTKKEDVIGKAFLEAFPIDRHKYSPFLLLTCHYTNQAYLAEKCDQAKAAPLWALMRKGNLCLVRKRTDKTQKN